MPKLFNRIFAYHKNNQVPLLTIDQRIELGQIVAKEYFVKHFVRRIHKVPAERGVEGNVWFYPKEFTPRMDKLILNYYRKIQRKK